MIKTIEKDINVTMTRSHGAWRSSERFIQSDYRALVSKYNALYPDTMIAAAIDEGDTVNYYQLIIIFKNEADEAEFILKECSND